jgi:hypothetical protein
MELGSWRFTGPNSPVLIGPALPAADASFVGYWAAALRVLSPQYNNSCCALADDGDSCGAIVGRDNEDGGPGDRRGGRP